MRRLWQSSAPARWITSALAALRGVRLHPSAALLGGTGRIGIARGASIGARCILRADGNGRITVGERAWFARDVELETETHVRIGARTTVQRRCSINGSTRVGADCIFAPDVFVSSGTHPFREVPHLPIREQERQLAARGGSVDAPVWIQDDCWIGTHAVIAPGVTIGKGSVIGANSVVTKDVPPYSVAAGIPAKVIGERLPWQPPARIDPRVATDAPYVLCTAEPLLVALRPVQPGERVKVSYRAEAPVRIEANGAHVDLAAGTGSFNVPAGQGLPFGAALAIEFDAGAVEFTGFEVAAAEA